MQVAGDRAVAVEKKQKDGPEPEKPVSKQQRKKAAVSAASAAAASVAAAAATAPPPQPNKTLQTPKSARQVASPKPTVTPKAGTVAGAVGKASDGHTGTPKAQADARRDLAHLRLASPGTSSPQQRPVAAKQPPAQRPNGHLDPKRQQPGSGRPQQPASPLVRPATVGLATQPRPIPLSQGRRVEPLQAHPQQQQQSAPTVPAWQHGIPAAKVLAAAQHRGPGGQHAPVPASSSGQPPAAPTQAWTGGAKLTTPPAQPPSAWKQAPGALLGVSAGAPAAQPAPTPQPPQQQQPPAAPLANGHHHRGDHPPPAQPPPAKAVRPQLPPAAVPGPEVAAAQGSPMRAFSQPPPPPPQQFRLPASSPWAIASSEASALPRPEPALGPHFPQHLHPGEGFPPRGGSGEAPHLPAGYQAWSSTGSPISGMPLGLTQAFAMPRSESASALNGLMPGETSQAGSHHSMYSGSPGQRSSKLQFQGPGPSRMQVIWEGQRVSG